MTWNDDGTVMFERAPSGAYVEEWRLVPGSRDPLTVIIDRRRPHDLPGRRRAPSWYAIDASRFHARRGCPSCSTTTPTIERCSKRCSTASSAWRERNDDRWMITTSTLPWQEGTVHRCRSSYGAVWAELAEHARLAVRAGADVAAGRVLLRRCACRGASPYLRQRVDRASAAPPTSPTRATT